MAAARISAHRMPLPGRCVHGLTSPSSKHASTPNAGFPRPDYYSIHESALGAPAYSSNTTLHFTTDVFRLCFIQRLRRLLHSLLHLYHTTRTSVPSLRPHLLQLPFAVVYFISTSVTPLPETLLMDTNNEIQSTPHSLDKLRALVPQPIR
jgi:hypothetical protein